MKWFKHASDASDDEFLSGLEDRFGLEGYARWFKLLEAVAKLMDGTEKCSATYSWKRWQKILKGKRSKLEPFLVHCQQQLRCNLVATQLVPETKRVTDGDQLEIKIPNLLKYRDNHTKNLQVTSKQEKEIDKEEEKEIERKTPKPPKGDSVKVENVPYEEMRTIWNTLLAGRLPEIKTITDKRKTQFKARWNDEIKKDIDRWKFICRKILEAPFLLGESGNPWHATIDFVLKPNNITKITEGAYAKGRGQQKSKDGGFGGVVKNISPPGRPNTVFATKADMEREKVHGF